MTRPTLTASTGAPRLTVLGCAISSAHAESPAIALPACLQHDMTHCACIARKLVLHKHCVSPASMCLQDVPGREALAQAAGILQTVDVTYGFTFPQSGWTQARRAAGTALACAGPGLQRWLLWPLGALPTDPSSPPCCAPQVASLRDHSNRVLYWRTPLTARWQGVNVSAAAAADGPQILPLWEGWEDAFEDVTALVRTAVHA